MTTIPDYKDLPYNETLKMHYSWGVFGAGDLLGALNKITPEAVKAAAAEVQLGQSIGLGQPINWPDPPFFGREPYVHEIFPTGRTGYDDRLDNFYPQGSSQWDGFRHVKAREFGLYGGFTEDPQPGEPTLGIQAWAEKGIVTRGVLIDAYRYLPEYDPWEDVRITAADITKIAEIEKVEIRSGDVLLLRFGWHAKYAAADEPTRAEVAERAQGRWAGLMPDEAMAEALWNWGVAAVAADNPALECAPGSAEIGSLHRRILPLLGIPIGEFFDLDLLSEACAADGRHSFLFSAMPFPLVGGVGSPANAVAVR